MQRQRRATAPHPGSAGTSGARLRRTALRPIAWLLLVLTVAGCASVNQSQPPVSYRLEFDPSATPDVAATGGILQIARPEALAGTDTRGLAYRIEPHQLRYYTKSQWADTPAQMLETALTSAIEASGMFKAVVNDGRVAADYLLTTQLLRLEQDLSAGNKGTTEIRLRLQLITLPERRLLGSRLIEASAANPSRDAEGAVAGAHAALSEAMADAIRFVAEAKQGAPRA